MVGKDGAKPLFPLLGLPLLERAIMTAAGAGLTEFSVVTGHRAAQVEAFLAELQLRRSLGSPPCVTRPGGRATGRRASCSRSAPG